MAQGAAIFTFHKIAAPPANTRDPFLYTDPGKFDGQLTSLCAFNLQAARLNDVRASLNGSARKFVVTFDDGFRNVFELGLEILSRHRVPAMQFIVAEFIGKQNAWDINKGDSAEPLMDAVQIKEWLAAGHEIGSHSATHPNLKRLGVAEVKQEVFDSKKSLEDKFGVPIRHFSYPFGGWTPAVREQVIAAGYETACGVEFGVNLPGADPFALRRIIPLSRFDLWRKVIHRLAQRTVSS